MTVNLDSLEPTIQHVGSELIISMPIVNSGSTAATNLVLNLLKLRTGGRANLMPKNESAIFPILLDRLEVGGITSVSGRFQDTDPQTGASLTGRSLQLFAGGGYTDSQSQLSFTVSASVTIPDQTSVPAPTLAAQMTVSVASGKWSYTVRNDSPAASQLKISAFALDLAAPISVVGIPAGWSVQTDNRTYVLWSAAPGVSTSQIAPGASLAGFQIQSSSSSSEAMPFSVNAWDFSRNIAGPVRADVILTPARQR
jgi:hypothetical protein